MYKNVIENLRDRNSITTLELANILGIDRTTYSHYEKENDIFPIKHLNKLCNYFNVSFDYIFGFTTIKNYPSTNSNIDIKTVSIRLKEFRKKNKLTQEKLASVLNVVKGTIGNYESNRSLIATPFLYDICKKYKISADYLLGKTNNPKYLK